MSIQGLQIAQDQLMYIFPRNISQLLSVTSLTSAMTRLQAQFVELNLVVPEFPYRLHRHKRVITCDFCKNHIVYEYSPQKNNGKIMRAFKLTSLGIEHRHLRKNGKAEVYQSWEPELLSDFHNGFDFMGYVDEKVQAISQNKSAVYMNQLFADCPASNKQKQPVAFEELLSYCSANSHYVYFQPQPLSTAKYPDFLLIVTPNMKKCYLQSARCIGFDFTFNLIKEVAINYDDNGESVGKKQYLVGLIAGLTNLRRIAIYGVVVCNQQSGYYVETAIAHFLEYVRKEPETIVTDQAIGMLSGLKKLKQSGRFHGEALWDTFHVLKSYKFHHRGLKKHMISMVRQKCKNKFHKMYLEAIRFARTQQEMDYVHKFMQESPKYAISQIKPVFVGIGVSDSQNEQVNNLIKMVIPNENKYVSVVHQILNIAEHRNELARTVLRETCKIDEILEDKQLSMIRYSLPATIHKFLYAQISRVHHCELLYQDGDFFCIQDQQAIHYIHKNPLHSTASLEFIQSPSPSHFGQLYFCSCSFRKKSGLPCEHIIKVCFETGDRIMDCIDRYWVIEDLENACRLITNTKIEKGVIFKKGARKGTTFTYFIPNKGEKVTELPVGVTAFPSVNTKVQEEKQNNQQLNEPLKNTVKIEEAPDRKASQKSAMNKKYICQGIYCPKDEEHLHRAEKMKKFFDEMENR